MGYAAPEVATGMGYSFEADVWSFGILLVELITGSLPFADTNDPLALQTSAVQGNIHISRPESLDPKARSLLKAIFVLEPNLRISISQIMAHRYFTKINWLKARCRELSMPMRESTAVCSHIGVDD